MSVLIAVDGSEYSNRAVSYAGRLLRDAAGVKVLLFHVLKPMPRELLEHGGSENPKTEKQLSSQLKEDQQAWIRQEEENRCDLLKKALVLLQQSGIDAGRVSMKFGHEEDVARNILEEARAHHFDTIVLGRHGTSGLKRLFCGGITYELLQQGTGLTFWVVE
jgi:nucleotide-binding universal stress UspA family protein